MTIPRRILMTADAVGGVWRYAIGLAREFCPAGVHIDLAVLGRRPAADFIVEAAEIPRLRLHCGDFPLEWMNCDWPAVDRSSQWLLELERATAPDVVHLNGYVHGALSWQAPALVVGHSSVCSWFEAVEGRAAPAEWSAYRQRVGRGLRSAAAVTAPTRAMLAALERLYGPFRAVGPIPNGCRPLEPAPLKQQIIFTAGRLWDRAKNAAALAAAATALDWPVYAAGADVSPDGRRIDLEPLRLLGQLPAAETADWMRNAAIFAAPARYEPFGLAILEAAAAGCALVLGDIPSLREIWDGCAVFVPPDDAEALRAVLAELIRSPESRRDWAERARQRSRRFTTSRTARAYLTLYERLMAQRRAPAAASTDMRSSWSLAAD